MTHQIPNRAPGTRSHLERLVQTLSVDQKSPPIAIEQDFAVADVRQAADRVQEIIDTLAAAASHPAQPAEGVG